MAAPTSAELAALLGEDAHDITEQAQAVLSVITAIVKSATRGNGFVFGVPNDDLQAIILTSAARLFRHPGQLAYGETRGPESVFFRSGFDGFTIAEQYVIARYRKTAA